MISTLEMVKTATRYRANASHSGRNHTTPYRVALGAVAALPTSLSPGLPCN